MKIKNKIVLVIIFLLITIEQVIKIVINNNFLNRKVPILPPFLYFQPMFNRDYSWFNSMFQLNVGKWIHVALVAFMIISIYLFYKYLNKQLMTNKMINCMFVFIFSGAMCSLIDKVLWNGSLDYIFVNGFFTFDLKDVYIDIFIGLLIVSLIFENKVVKQVNDNNILKDFIKYILPKHKSK